MPSLEIVGDDGVYILNHSTKTNSRNVENHPKVVYAEECNPKTMEFDDWWEVKNNSFGGDDGVELLPIDSELFDTDEDDYDWQSKGAENLIVVDGDKINITHYIEWEDDAVTKTRSAKKYQKIEIGNTDEEVKLSTINLTTDTKSELSMKEDNFSMKVTGSDGEDVTGIECSADAVKINKNNEQELIKIAANGIFIKSTGTVEITGSSVRIKGAGNRIVTTTAEVGQKIASLGQLVVSGSEAE